MLHSQQCKKCKKFAKEIKKWTEGRETCRVLKCKSCGAYTYSAISYGLAVWGEMIPHVYSIEIKPGSERWNKYMDLN